MKTLIALASALIAFAPAAHGVTVVFTATLSGLAENPVNASPGLGSATVTIDTVAHTLRVQQSFSGLLGTTTASHIHCCVAVPGGNVGVATTTPTFFGFPLGVTSGSMDQTYDTLSASTYNPAFIIANGGTPASAEAVLFAGMIAGNSYLNDHTSVFGGGEIRGFLVTAVPEPETYALFLAGLGLVGVAVRRRQGRAARSATSSPTVS